MSVLPDFFSDALIAKLEKDVVNSLLSSWYSMEITALWRSGDAKWAGIIGENAALKDAATAGYISLQALKQKGIVLTVPKDLLASDNLAKFQTESVGK